MARINWNGSEIEATVVEQLLNGNYRMMAREHAPRIESGTIVEVSPKDIVSLDIGGAKFLGPGAATAGLGPQFQVPVTPPSEADVVDKMLGKASTPQRKPGAAPMVAKHFAGLVGDLRAQVKSAVADAIDLKARGSQSLGAFKKAQSDLHGVYDEVDAATAEINGALLEPGGNGGPAADDVKN